MAIRYLGRTRIARGFFLASVSSLVPRADATGARVLAQWRKEEKGLRGESEGRVSIES
jgi:hypothetical protein